MDDRYCYVIVENGRPVFVSMTMSKVSCETMMTAMGEGEVVTADVGLAYKRAMASPPTKIPLTPMVSGPWRLLVMSGYQDDQHLAPREHRLLQS